MKRLESKGRRNSTKVVERIEDEQGFVLERYEDGDCLLTPGPGAYVQLSAALIAHLAQTVPKPKTRLTVLDENDHSVVKRSIRKLTNESGWLCTMSRESGHDEVHVYVTRGQARQAHFGTQIGESGRIA